MQQKMTRKNVKKLTNKNCPKQSPYKVKNVRVYSLQIGLIVL